MYLCLAHSNVSHLVFRISFLVINDHHWKGWTLTNCFTFRLSLCSENNEIYQKPRHFDGKIHLLYVFCFCLYNLPIYTYFPAGFNSLYLYRRWYRCFTTLSSFSFEDAHVERKDDLSLDQFRSQYDGKSPVRIELTFSFNSDLTTCGFSTLLFLWVFSESILLVWHH